MSKGRVLIVTYVFPPEEGGLGMAAYEMACSLSSLDWDIHVLTRPLDSPDESFRSHQYSPLTTLPDTLTKDSARLIPGRVSERFPAGCYYLPLLGGLVSGRIAGRGTGFRHSVFPPLPWCSYQFPLFFPLQLPSFLRPEKMALLLFSNTQEYPQRMPEITVKPSRFSRSLRDTVQEL